MVGIHATPDIPPDPPIRTGIEPNRWSGLGAEQVPTMLPEGDDDGGLLCLFHSVHCFFCLQYTERVRQLRSEVKFLSFLALDCHCPRHRIECRTHDQARG